MSASYGEGARPTPPLPPTMREYQGAMKRSVLCKTFGLVFFIFFTLVAVVLLAAALWMGLGEGRMEGLPQASSVVSEEQRLYVGLPVALVCGCASLAVAATVLTYMVKSAVAVSRLRAPRGLPPQVVDRRPPPGGAGALLIGGPDRSV